MNVPAAEPDPTVGDPERPEHGPARGNLAPQIASHGNPAPQVAVDPVPRMARAFQGKRAGVVTRTAAGAIDYAVVAGAVVGTFLAIGILRFLLDPRALAWPTWTLLQMLVIGGVYFVLYLTLAWSLTGRSLGARVMGVRVVSFNGRRMFFLGALLRALFCVAFPIGLFWCVVSRKNRSVQDVVLRTSVIHDWANRASSNHFGADHPRSTR
ncbi:MAG: RDD family protein [Candidatus Nanopelagicales bacterium]